MSKMNNNDLINDFCFVVVSYNQEKYVFQHLESIKYLIKKYGTDKKIQIVFSDDASSDKTTLLAELWFEQNKELFNQQQIIKRKKTIGTIRNMIDAYKHVNAKSYKLTACDDLYFINDVFSVGIQADIILTPTIHFFDNHNVVNTFNTDYLQMIDYQNRGILKNQIKQKLDYRNFIEAPGVFLDISIWKEKSFQDFLLQYKFIEDIPEWYYIFNVCKKDLKVILDSTPYILYRHGVGISTKIKIKGNPVDEEYKRIRIKIKAKYDLLPKFINPYIYTNWFCVHINNYKFQHKQIIIASLKEWNRNVASVEQHLSYIECQAKEFQNSIQSNDNNKNNTD